MPRKSKQLPVLTLSPSLRPRGSFTPFSVDVDPDESTVIHLHIYGYGMDVEAVLDEDHLRALKAEVDQAVEYLDENAR